MAIISGTEYDHIDLKQQGAADATRHMLKDAQARQGLDDVSGMIAPTEASTTASMAHAAGSYFILGDTLYVATAAIAVGAEIVTSGSEANCRAAVLGGELSDLNTGVNNLASGFVKKQSVNFATAPTKAFYISSVTGKYSPSSRGAYYIPVPEGAFSLAVTGNAENTMSVALLKSANPVSGTYPDYAAGQTRENILAGETKVFILPSDCHYVYMTLGSYAAQNAEFSSFERGALESDIAPDYQAISFPVAVGELCWNSGVLYAAKQDIPASENWTAEHWQETNISAAIQNANIGPTGDIIIEAVIGDVDDTFPLTFEGGTYSYTSVGSTLSKYYGGGYDKTRKVVATTVFNAPCDVSLIAKTGYAINLFTASSGVIVSAESDLTAATLMAGSQYGIVLKTIGGNDDISEIPVSSIVEIEYIDKIKKALNGIDEITDVLTAHEEVNFSEATVRRGLINAANKWSTNSGFYSYAFNVDSSYFKMVVTAGSSYATNVGLLKNSNLTNGATPPFCDGMTADIRVAEGETAEIAIPSDCRYIVLMKAASTADYTPANLTFYKWNVGGGESSTPQNIKMPLELGRLRSSTYTLYDSADSYTDFYTTMRTPHFLDVRKCSDFAVLSSFDVITAVFYNYDYTFKNTVSVTAGVSVRIPNGACFARFMVKNANDAPFTHDKDFISLSCIGDVRLLKSIANMQNTDSMIMCYSVPGQVGRDHSGDTMQTPGLVDTTGLIKLPPNYDNDGAPVPLIVYAHGSEDYKNKWQSSIRGGIGYTDVINYLVNEGFAVFDSFGHSSAVTFTSGAYPHTYGSVDCMNCYIAGIRRAMDVYNLRTDGVYVTGISSGGIAAINLAFNNTIPVLACAPLAPVISVLTRYLGYNEQQRKEFAWAQGFVGDYDVLNGRNQADANITSVPEYTQDLVDFLEANASRLIGYNPMWNGVVGVPFSTLVARSMQREGNYLGGGDHIPENWTNDCRVCKTPIKIWVADDDVNVSPISIKIFLNTLKNGNCIGELRSVPNGQGGHSCFTSSETTTRTSGTTSLGIAFTNIPIYWMEMVAFFRSF